MEYLHYPTFLDWIEHLFFLLGAFWLGYHWRDMMAVFTEWWMWRKRMEREDDWQ